LTVSEIEHATAPGLTATSALSDDGLNDCVCLDTDKKLALIVVLNDLRNKHKSLQSDPGLNPITLCNHRINNKKRQSSFWLNFNTPK
jgi:hypothetical protein